MKNSILIGAALALLLTACAGVRTQTAYSERNPRLEGFAASRASPPNSTAPNVFVVHDKIVVDQEPVRPVGAPGSDVTIYFALAQDGGYEFPQPPLRPHGIEIVGHPRFCDPVTGSKYVYVCRYVHPAADTIYKYVIRVRNEATGQMLRDLDPQIWN